MDRFEIEVHTDGSCYPNPNGHGGWAFVARCGAHLQQRRGYVADTTNNAMELTAILYALRFVGMSSRPLRIVTDSNYARSALMQWLPNWRANGWRTGSGSPVANRETLEQCDALIRAHRSYREFDLVWTRGHVGTRDNEIADSLAGQARIDRGTDWKPEDDRNARFLLEQSAGEDSL